jgi:hydroxymethylpyrimidine pyrophosphatase-like HAD family hydrolase
MHRKPLVFTDLDDTMFVNQRKLPEDFSGRCIPVVEDTDDRVSVMTAKQEALFRWLSATAELIPVTARSSEAFARIDLDFGGGWKIAGNGAVVIGPDGLVDREWTEIISSELVEYGEDLERSLDEALAYARECGVDVAVKRYREHDHEHCVLLSLSGDQASMLGLVFARMSLSEERLHVHHNGGTLAFTAKPVSKKRAVEYVMSKIPDIEERPVLTFGDSLSDLPFMALGDFICAPNGSQIASKL